MPFEGTKLKIKGKINIVKTHIDISDDNLINRYLKKHRGGEGSGQHPPSEERELESLQGHGFHIQTARNQGQILLLFTIKLFP